jgi:hypothetical protein
MPTHLGGDYEPTPFRSMEDHLAKANHLSMKNLRVKGSSFDASTDRKTSLLRDRPARRAVKRAYRIWVSDAAHHCVQLRIDLLFTMSDNLHRDDRGSTRYKFKFMDELLEFTSTSIVTINRHSTKGLVEPDGIEPTTSCLQSRRSPN